MRKILALCFFITGYPYAMAWSGRFSVEGAPTLSINWISSWGKPPMTHQGCALRMHFGGAYHFILQEHCALSTGISYSSGHMGFKRAPSSDSTIVPIDEIYFLQAIWLPILGRFYSSEVMLDTSIYCKLGLIPAIQLPSRVEKSNTKSNPFFKERGITCLVLLGGGVKYDFSLTNSILIGLSYGLDVAGVMHKYNPTYGAIYGHNHFACLDIGFLF